MAGTTEPGSTPAPRRWTIMVPWDPQLTSPNRRQHFMARARLVREGRENGRLAWLLAERPRATRRITIDAQIYRGASIDDDNAIAGLKCVRDGLCNDALTPDDSARWVRWGSVQVIAGKQYRGREHVILTITEES